MITIEVDLTSETMPKDWSLVAWAPDEVYVYPVDEARVSDSFQVLGGDGREGFVRPELPLPTHDSSAFIEWATTTHASPMNREGTWVQFSNTYETHIQKVTMQFFKSDWNMRTDTFLS